MAHFRISNSLEHLRAEERGGADAYASNPDLLVLRKLIEEEMEHVSPDGGLQAPWSPPPLGVGSGFFTARPPPGQLSVGRWAAPGHWAAEGWTPRVCFERDEGVDRVRKSKKAGKNLQ